MHFSCLKTFQEGEQKDKRRVTGEPDSENRRPHKKALPGGKSYISRISSAQALASFVPFVLQKCHLWQLLPSSLGKYFLPF